MSFQPLKVTKRACILYLEKYSHDQNQLKTAWNEDACSLREKLVDRSDFWDNLSINNVIQLKDASDGALRLLMHC